ncbi:MAG: DUF6483 family protein [Agathobacter sp.]|nr:DUF6483 family protein [Agathobacter sp.]MDY4892010.1 DUF6483 family protein [Agathobacter sp.]
MAYENDFIMRQVRDITRILAKILFRKNTATYEYQTEDHTTASDSLYARLIAMVDEGKINEAENRLFEELECDEEGIFEAALGFYDYLNSLPEEFLEEHNYTRDEVKEGAQSLADRKGLGVLE